MDSKWDSIIFRLEQKLGDLEIEKLKETQTDDLGHELVSDIERVKFNIDGRQMRLDHVVRPMILDKKTHYSHTAGQHTNIEYIVSDTETTEKIIAYVYDRERDAWMEIGEGSGFSF